jgi:hypothetical protein
MLLPIMYNHQVATDIVNSAAICGKPFFGVRPELNNFYL